MDRVPPPLPPRRDGPEASSPKPKSPPPNARRGNTFAPEGKRKRISLVRNAPSGPVNPGQEFHTEDLGNAEFWAERESVRVKSSQLARNIVIGLALVIVLGGGTFAALQFGPDYFYPKPPLSQLDLHFKTQLIKDFHPDAFLPVKIDFKLVPLKDGSIRVLADATIEQVQDLYKRADAKKVVRDAGDNDDAFRQAIDRAVTVSRDLAAQAPRPALPLLVTVSSPKGTRQLFAYECRATLKEKVWTLSPMRERNVQGKNSPFRGETALELNNSALIVGGTQAKTAVDEYIMIRKEYVALVESRLNQEKGFTRERTKLSSAFNAGEIYLGLMSWKGSRYEVILEFTQNRFDGDFVEALFALQKQAVVQKRLTGRLEFAPAGTSLGAVAKLRGVYESGIQPNDLIPGIFFSTTSREITLTLNGDQLVGADKDYHFVLRKKGAGPLLLDGTSIGENRDVLSSVESPLPSLPDFPMYAAGQFPSGIVKSVAEWVSAPGPLPSSSWLHGVLVMRSTLDDGTYLFRPLADSALPSELTTLLNATEIHVTFPSGPPGGLEPNTALQVEPDAPLEILSKATNDAGVLILKTRWRQAGSKTTL